MTPEEFKKLPKGEQSRYMKALEQVMASVALDRSQMPNPYNVAEMRRAAKKRRKH